MRKQYPIALLLMIFSTLCINADAQNIYTVAGNGVGTVSTGDGGPSIDASIYVPTDVAPDPAGNWYIACPGLYVIRKVNSAGIITTVAGNLGEGYTGDGGPATDATFASPNYITFDAAGNMYIADELNNVVRKVNTSGIITRFAGNGYGAGLGLGAYSGDGGPATDAELFYPDGLTVDASGNLYISDFHNNVIRKVNTSGIISTVAGNYILGFGYEGDGGPATNARIDVPIGLATDAAGNLYIADNNNNAVRKVSTTGIITTVAGGFGACCGGGGPGGYGGDGGLATDAWLNGPWDVKLDAAGNLYISDEDNFVIRKVNTSGIISTVAGDFSLGYGYSGDGGPATLAQMFDPEGIAISSAGNLYIADDINEVVREVNLSGIEDPAVFSAGPVQYLSVCNNGTSVSIDAMMQVDDPDIGRFETLSVADAPPHGSLSGFPATDTSTGGIVTPSGLSYTPVAGYTGPDSFSVAVTTVAGLVSTTTVYVSVNPVPVVAAVTGPDTVCFASTITLHDVTGAGVWSSSSTYNATVGAGGIVTGLHTGLDTVSYTVTNIYGCATAAPQYLDVDSLTSIPEIDVVGYPTGDTVTTCSGDLVIVEDWLGSEGTWSSSNPVAAPVTPLGDVTLMTTGIDTIFYSVTNVCGVSVARQVIVVDSAPVLSVIAGPATICTGSSATLTESATGGIWSSVGWAVATIVSTGAVTGLTAGTSTISYSASNLCGISAVTDVITVLGSPSVAAIGGSSTVCTGATITISDATAGGTWHAANGNATISGTSVTGVTAGTDLVSYSVTNSCGTTTETQLITVNAAPTTAGTITGHDTVCTGSTITLSDGTTGGSWTTGNTNASVSGGVVTGESAGTDSVVYTVSNACGSVHTAKNIHIRVCPSGVDEITSGFKDLKVYPNPVADELVIENAAAGSVIKLFNMPGQQVYSSVVNGSKQVIDMRSLTPGTYIVQITDVNGNRMNKTVVKE